MQKHTLKELTEIGSKAALDLYGSGREAFAKAILDAIGYEFPKDEEREAFEKWYECVLTFGEAKEVIFASWKAGREELRKSQSLDKQPSYSNEPEWIPWNGGECPLSDKVKRWEYKMRNGKCHLTRGSAQETAYWHHLNLAGDIIAYRVWE